MELLTLRDIEKETGVTRKQLAYAADTYGIEPRQRAGMVKLFAREDVARIIAAVKRVAERRGLVRP